MKCGHHWWTCAHPELAMPWLGKAIMAVGFLYATVGLAMVLRG